MRYDMTTLTADEVAHLNDLSRRYVGKPLEALTPNDVAQIQSWLAVEVLLMRAQQRMAVEGLSELLPTLDVDAMMATLERGKGRPDHDDGD